MIYAENAYQINRSSLAQCSFHRSIVRWRATDTMREAKDDDYYIVI